MQSIFWFGKVENLNFLEEFVELMLSEQSNFSFEDYDDD